MTSFSQKRSADYVRTYRSMLLDATRPRILPKLPSKTKIYSPPSTVSTMDATSVFIPLFYAGEKGALGIWDKRTGIGVVKRRLDDDERSYHVLELSNPRTNLGTFISTPKSALNALHITLPHMVIAMKNYRRNFAFDVLVMDNMAYRRRFCFSTWYNPSALKKFAFMCQVPLRLEIGWNEIHVNFSDLVKSAYKTEYVETIRIQIYANCKLRQIFFCDDRIITGQIPIPSMRDFGNIRILPLDYGPRTHPDGIESGPEKNRKVPYVDPPTQIAPTRLEQDLRLLQRRRFAQITDQKLYIQPYKTYFRDLMSEQKQRKKIEAALKAELEAKSKQAKLDNESKTESPNILTAIVETSAKVATMADIRDLLSVDTSFKPAVQANGKEMKVVKVPASSPAPVNDKEVKVVSMPLTSPAVNVKDIKVVSVPLTSPAINVNDIKVVSVPATSPAVNVKDVKVVKTLAPPPPANDKEIKVVKVPATPTKQVNTQSRENEKKAGGSATKTNKQQRSRSSSSTSSVESNNLRHLKAKERFGLLNKKLQK